MKQWTLLTAVVLALGSTEARAQSSSLFGNRGVTGSSGTMSNGVGGGGNSAGSSESGFGNSGSMTGFTGATAGTQAGFLSGVSAGSGIAGTSNSGNFVGNRNLTTTGGASSGGRGGFGGGSSLSGFSRNNNSQRNRGNTNRGTNQGSQSVPIRPIQRIGFSYNPRPSMAIATSVSSQISVPALQGRFQGVSVMAGTNGQVTLRGQVGSESDRRKAELMARLEPGVRDVVNELAVAPQP